MRWSYPGNERFPYPCQACDGTGIAARAAGIATMAAMNRGFHQHVMDNLRREREHIERRLKGQDNAEGDR